MLAATSCSSWDGSAPRLVMNKTGVPALQCLASRRSGKCAYSTKFDSSYAWTRRTAKAVKSACCAITYIKLHACPLCTRGVCGRCAECLVVVGEEVRHAMHMGPPTCMSILAQQCGRAQGGRSDAADPQGAAHKAVHGWAQPVWPHCLQHHQRTEADLGISSSCFKPYRLDTPHIVFSLCCL